MKRLILFCTAFLISVLIGQASKAAIGEDGFVSIFNGQDLTGWEGDPRLWSVKDGAILGQTTEENPAQYNTFCIWRAGKLKNFVLKIKFRIQNGNSGIQYRSKEFEKWRISGYQAEVVDKPGAVGLLYHEAGRAMLANVGDFVVIDQQGKANVAGKVADVEALNKAGYYKEKDWNEYTIIARGNHIEHYLNGHQTIELIDNDRITNPDDPSDHKGAAREGLLALQIHRGPPMVVEFKDIRIKHLPENYGNAIRLFNGKNLSGWTFASDELKETFGVKDGVITDTGQPRGYIRTTEDYTNYVLRLQLRHIQAGNSGVLLRMTGPDKVWPKSIEAQGASDNMGDIWNIDNVPMKVDPARTKDRRTVKLHPSNEKPVGQWNEYEIYVNGGDLQIYVNRLLQNYATECQETSGKICLQSEGSPKEFRNIVLIPIISEKKIAFEITSTAFKEGGYISRQYTGEGQDVSPPLSWTGTPAGTKSFALICDDPDAPAKTWVHWVIYNIPANATGLPEAIPKKDALPDGSRQGVTDFGRVGYGGPMPPRGPAHRYFFKLYALDSVLNLSPGATKSELLRAMEGRVLAESQLIGLYKR